MFAYCRQKVRSKKPNYAYEIESLLWVLIDIKYISLGGSCNSKKSNGSFKAGLRKKIRRGGVGVFSHPTRFVMGDGSKICFWHDAWHGDQSSIHTFPKLFKIASNKETYVVNHCHMAYGFTRWSRGGNIRHDP